MTNVAGHLREQNGMYQMILSWKDTNGKRRTKSISTGLPVKGNKKRAESLLRKTQKEFNPETMQQVSDLPVSEYLNRWLRESVMNLPPETYGRYAYDLGRVVVPYFEKKRLSLKALSPRDLETFFRYERQQEEASVQQLLDWHKELTDSVGVDSFRDMTPEHISSFLSTSIPDLVRNLRATLCHLRVFFRYLYLNEFTKDDLSLFIPKSNVLLKRKHIPSTWTREDIDKILACIDLASPVGKRDYAIILLVARLGIRVSDVIRLEFDNIKWEKNCIQISQYKTNEPLVLPLFEDVGQAIIDYVKNGRPASDLKLVFITHKPPFQKFSDNNHLYGMFNKYLYKAGIEVTPEKNHGMHTLRHSLANELLRKEIPLPVISEILGHKSLETTMQYLRADTEQLRCCTLVEGENYAVTT